MCRVYSMFLALRFVARSGGLFTKPTDLASRLASAIRPSRYGLPPRKARSAEPPCGVFPCEVLSCGVFPCGVFPCGVFPCGVIPCEIFSCGIFPAKFFPAGFSLAVAESSPSARNPRLLFLSRADLCSHALHLSFTLRPPFRSGSTVVLSLL